MIEIATDGACRFNPGPGGWAAIIIENDEVRSISGGDPATTNNRMELYAAIAGLEAVPAGSTITLYTDSRYVCDGITKWVHGWRRRGWKSADGGAVKNKDLWQRLVAAAAPHSVTWTWCRGHSGHKYNEMADAAARQAVPRTSP